MDNLLDIYTKLRLNIGNEIIVTYHSSDGNKHTKEFILLDITDFSFLFVGNSSEIMNIPFFSSSIIIESITFKTSSKPIYLNQYFNNEKSTISFTDYAQFEKIIEEILNNNELTLKKRKKLVEEYLAKIEDIKYDKLFFSQKQKEEFELFFNMLVQELSEYARKNNLDPRLKEVSIGTTSIIYEIGDKIIKVGKPRRKKTIPYCEYLLQPIINRDFEFDGYPIHIEITQKVFVLDNKDGFASQSEDERFQEAVSILSKNLYSIGLTSDDLHPGNVGILLDDNKIHFDGITFATANSEVTSIENNNCLRILPKGRSVIIDLDSLIIEDRDKYYQYLESIGFNKDKTKCLKTKD